MQGESEKHGCGEKHPLVASSVTLPRDQTHNLLGAWEDAQPTEPFGQVNILFYILTNMYNNLVSKLGIITMYS